MDYRVYRQNVKIKADAEVEEMVGEEVPEGYILEITAMSVSNITAGGDILELGYIDVAGEYRTICIDEGAQMHHHHLTGRVFLMAGEKPYGRIDTPGANNVCYFNCHGKLWPVE